MDLLLDENRYHPADTVEGGGLTRSVARWGGWRLLALWFAGDSVGVTSPNVQLRTHPCPPPSLFCNAAKRGVVSCGRVAGTVDSDGR